MLLIDYLPQQISQNSQWIIRKALKVASNFVS